MHIYTIKYHFLMLMCQLMGVSLSPKFAGSLLVKGWGLNYKSECANRYKDNVIRTYIRRAFKICSSEVSFHQVHNKIKKVLVSNGYSNLAFDEELMKFKRWMNKQNDERDNIPVYFENQMTPSHRVDESILKSMLSRNIHSI